jgi:hypothetical protein
MRPNTQNFPADDPARAFRMGYVTNFFAGAFLCNCVPHLVSALQGSPFPTPFAKPHGVGLSTPLVNFIWGFANLLAGLGLVAIRPVQLGVNVPFLLFMLGVGVVGAFSSIHFGKVRRDGFR